MKNIMHKILTFILLALLTSNAMSTSMKNVLFHSNIFGILNFNPVDSKQNEQLFALPASPTLNLFPDSETTKPKLSAEFSAFCHSIIEQNQPYDTRLVEILLNSYIEYKNSKDAMVLPTLNIPNKKPIPLGSYVTLIEQHIDAAARLIFLPIAIQLNNHMIQFVGMAFEIENEKITKITYLNSPDGIVPANILRWLKNDNFSHLFADNIKREIAFTRPYSSQTSIDDCGVYLVDTFEQLIQQKTSNSIGSAQQIRKQQLQYISPRLVTDFNFKLSDDSADPIAQSQQVQPIAEQSAQQLTAPRHNEELATIENGEQYSDQLVDKLLQLYLNQNPANKITAFATLNIDNQDSPLLGEYIQSIQKCIENGAELIFIPFWQQLHFVGIVLTIKNKQIINIKYIDSLGNAVSQNILAWLSKFCPNNLEPELVFDHNHHPQRKTDGSNCGVYLVNAFKQIAQQENPRAKANVTQMRTEQYQLLLESLLLENQPLPQVKPIKLTFGDDPSGYALGREKLKQMALQNNIKLSGKIIADNKILEQFGNALLEKFTAEQICSQYNIAFEELEKIKKWLHARTMSKKSNEKQYSDLAAGKALLKTIAQEQNPPLNHLSTDDLCDLATKIGNDATGIIGVQFAMLTQEDRGAIEAWRRTAESNKNISQARAAGKALLKTIAQEQNPPCYNPSTDYLYDLAINIGNEATGISGTQFAMLTQEDRGTIEAWRRTAENNKKYRQISGPVIFSDIPESESSCANSFAPDESTSPVLGYFDSMTTDERSQQEERREQTISIQTTIQKTYQAHEAAKKAQQPHKQLIRHDQNAILQTVVDEISCEFKADIVLEPQDDSKTNSDWFDPNYDPDDLDLMRHQDDDDYYY